MGSNLAKLKVAKIFEVLDLKDCLWNELVRPDKITYEARGSLFGNVVKAFVYSDGEYRVYIGSGPKQLLLASGTCASAASRLNFGPPITMGMGFPSIDFSEFKA